MSGAMALMFIRCDTIMAELYYLIGASGSGKDSLIRYARTHMPDSAPIVFTHRYITRQADAGGENHVALNEKEFLSRQKNQCFAMSWYSHNTHYGIGIEINQWLEKDLSVVVNGSRAYLDEASKSYPGLQAILISVYPEILRQRLEKRGRETREQIESRLLQAHKLEQEISQSRWIKIYNNDSLNKAGDQFISILNNGKNSRCA